jgi:hypothetical protein
LFYEDGQISPLFHEDGQISPLFHEDGQDAQVVYLTILPGCWPNLGMMNTWSDAHTTALRGYLDHPVLS